MDRLDKLRQMPTRKLLILLRETYTPSYWYEDESMGYFAPEFTEEDIKSVLATRPHIPNKVEGEVIRRGKAKTRKDARNNKYVRRR
jgi:hypothetical protein